MVRRQYVEGSKRDREKWSKQDKSREKARGRQWDFIRIGVARGP